MVVKIYVLLMIVFSFASIHCTKSVSKVPPKPPYINLRGVNSNAFDLDVGSIESEKNMILNIDSYRFEILPKSDLTKDEGRWTNQRVVLQGFEDGEEIDFAIL